MLGARSTFSMLALCSLGAHVAAAPSYVAREAEPDLDKRGFAEGLTSDQQAYLDGHNNARRQHGARDLVWSDALASAAQRWANGCKFAHSQGSVGPYGENLAAGTGNFTIPAAIKLWTDEVAQYNRNAPVASHYTQVVWKSTTQLGCAHALCEGIFPPSFGDATFYVCEYSPPGNINGQFGANVQP